MTGSGGEDLKAEGNSKRVRYLLFEEKLKNREEEITDPIKTTA